MIRYVVIFTETAESDLEEIENYISIKYGDRWSADLISIGIVNKCSKLSIFPAASQIKYCFQGKKLRSVHYKKYAILYYIKEDSKKVYVHRILHSRQNLVELFS